MEFVKKMTGHLPLFVANSKTSIILLLDRWRK